MKKHLVAGVGLVVLCSSGDAQTLGIDHQPVGCAVAEKFPRLEARFAPADTVATARVLFQGENTQEWYAVVMKPEGGTFAGVLPKPKKSLKAFRYYIEVTDKALGTNRTAEYTTSVVDSSSACKGKITAATLASASVIVQGPAGVAALPAGFATSGVIAGSASASGAPSGTAAAGGSSAGGAASAGAAAGGGGIGATALVVGGLAAGGAVAVGAVAKGGARISVTILSVTIVTSSGSLGSQGIPQIDVSACRADTTLGGGNIPIRSDGSFDETWNPNTPALRLVGRADASGLQATLSCLSGSGPTGSMSASGSGYSLTGTFTFGASRFGSQGTISVSRVQ